MLYVSGPLNILSLQTSKNKYSRSLDLYKSIFQVSGPLQINILGLRTSTNQNFRSPVLSSSIFQFPRLPKIDILGLQTSNIDILRLRTSKNQYVWFRGICKSLKYNISGRQTSKIILQDSGLLKINIWSFWISINRFFRSPDFQKSMILFSRPL